MAITTFLNVKAIKSQVITARPRAAEYEIMVSTTNMCVRLKVQPIFKYRQFDLAIGEWQNLFCSIGVMEVVLIVDIKIYLLFQVHFVRRPLKLVSQQMEVGFENAANQIEQFNVFDLVQTLRNMSCHRVSQKVASSICISKKSIRMPTIFRMIFFRLVHSNRMFSIPEYSYGFIQFSIFAVFQILQNLMIQDVSTLIKVPPGVKQSQ